MDKDRRAAALWREVYDRVMADDSIPDGEAINVMRAEYDARMEEINNGN